MTATESPPSTAATLRSLVARIESARAIREESTRLLERLTPAERPQASVQLTALTQSVREELEAVDGVRDLILLAPRLQTDWPFPSGETLHQVQSELASRARKPIDEIMALPVVELVKIMGGTNGSVHPVSPSLTVSLPDVSSLPRWARVAFATRTARRVERLLEETAPQAPSELLSSFSLAIGLAEQSAAAASTAPGTNEAADKALALIEQAGPIPHRNGKVTSGASSGNVLNTVGRMAAAVARSAATEDPAPAREVVLLASGAASLLTSSTLRIEDLRDLHFLEERAKREAWTDATPVSPDVIPQSSLRLTGMHIREARAIRRLDLPQDGLGWGEAVPELAVLGGVNGSGKTTLLRMVAAMLGVLPQADTRLGYINALDELLGTVKEAWLEFQIESYELLKTRFRILLGSPDFIREKGGDNYWGVTPARGGGGYVVEYGRSMAFIRQLTRSVGRTTMPTCLYLPSENRNLVVPEADYKAAGKLSDDSQFVHRWRPPVEWRDSIEALLYGLRWEDLNAKEEGRSAAANQFDAYSEAFRRFTGDAKSLRFVDGRLVVIISSTGAMHDLSTLSGGERQMLLLTGELLRYWRPGSMILIDEPELHLHARWQTQLYHALRFWQKERGGQVIIATQSSHLAALAGPGASALLGADSL